MLIRRAFHSYSLKTSTSVLSVQDSKASREGSDKICRVKDQITLQEQ